MTDEEVKAWLGRARGIDAEIRAIQEEKAAAFNKLLIPAQTTDERVQTSRQNVRERRIAAHIDYEAVLDARIDELYDAKREIIAVIWRVKNQTYRILLFRRYIRGEKWEEIAEHMHYSVRQTRRAAANAIKAAGETIENCPQMSLNVRL